MSRKLEQELVQMVDRVDAVALTAQVFQGFIGDLRNTLCAIGRETLEQVLMSKDPAQSSIEIGGERHRFRGMVEKEWLTCFGKVPLPRRTYRADGVGKKTIVPLDDCCGMRGRFMASDVEEMVALGMAMLTAAEVELLLGKALPEGPSATAIQRAVANLGKEVAERREVIEAAIDREAPLSTKGDILVSSFDGVMVPVRENTDVAWREAGVAAISIYGKGADGPEKLDTRYLARMPEFKMKTLLEQIEDQVVRVKQGRAISKIVLLCDGKETIWSVAGTQPSLRDAVWILDFYHASENLMKAAKAIHGEDDVAATRWHEKLRSKLLVDDRGVDNAIRTMRRCRARLKAGSERWNVVDNAIDYFGKNRERMRYLEFLVAGLPIGSGPVEAAAKNIVQARLKRSGMRWSREGGQHVLDLRAYLKSGRWAPMWSTLLKAA
jgi:hypothetical protein